MKTVRASKIVDIEDKYFEVPIWDCIEDIIKDIYDWACKNNYQIIDIIYFPIMNTFDYLIHYK